MQWIFDGMSVEDISRGIYLSIANKVAKMKLVPDVPTVMIGGVIANHPFLQSLLSEQFDKAIETVEEPQHTVSLGAAITAQKYWNKEKTVKDKLSVEPKQKIEE